MNNVEGARRLLEAADALRNDGSIVEPLAASTGLSAAGVRFALQRSLEAPISDGELTTLASRTAASSTVTVILSANVFTAALRALVLARLASPRVRVRPSRRESLFPRLLVEAAADPAVTLEPSLDLATVEEGEVHVYGRDETVAAVAASLRPGVRLRGHGAGLGVAWVDIHAATEDTAARLAEDVIAFDQRGCLSPRLVFAAGPSQHAQRFAALLHEALAAMGERIPRGELDAATRGELLRHRDSFAFAGEVWESPTSLVALAPEGAPVLLGPPARCVTLVGARTDADVVAHLQALAPSIVCFGADDERGARLAPPHARLARLGAMQRPPLDGPVDGRPSLVQAGVAPRTGMI